MYGLLVVTSEFEMAGTIPGNQLQQQLDFLQSSGIKTKLLTDPTQLALEHEINQNDYDCIYTTTQYSYELVNKNVIRRNFNIIKMLEHFDKDFIGSNYATQTFINDKTLSGKNSGIAPRSWLVTREMFESNRSYTENKIPTDIFPLIVKPNTLTCSLGVTRDSIVNDHKTLENQLEIIFQRFRELKEIRVEKFIENAREFTVSVIGNSEAFYTSVTELIFDDVGPHVYGEEEKKKNIESRPVKYNLIDDTKIKEELIFHAKRLFNWFGMRDMGRFDFLYDTRAYLVDVNALPVSGNSLSWEWQKNFNIGKKMGLAFYLAAFHFRQMASGRPDPLPNSLLNTLPEEILRNIQNPRPLLSVPESTTPNEYCRKPHLFTMIDRVSAETEVLQFLKALVMLVKPSLIIETGTFKGATAAAMVCGLLENGYGKLVTIELDETLAERSARKFQGFPVEVVCGSSLTYTPNDKIDMLFIDSHRAIRGKEFEHFKPHLRDNAVIVWHDSAPEHTAVFKAVSALYDNQVIDRILLPTPRGLTISMLKKIA